MSQQDWLAYQLKLSEQARNRPRSTDNNSEYERRRKAYQKEQEEKAAQALADQGPPVEVRLGPPVEVERKPAPQPSAPNTESSLPEGFAAFLAELAAPSALKRDDAGKLPPIASGNKWPSKVLAAPAPTNPHFAKFVKEFQTELIQRYQQDQARAEFKQQQSDNLDDVLRRARSGEFTTTYMDNFGTIRQRDDGMSASLGALAKNIFTNVMTSVAENMFDPGGTEGFTSRLLTTRFLELKKLLPKIYPPSPDCAKMVDFIVTESVFGLRNVSGKDLTQVTIIIELTGFCSPQEPFLIFPVYLSSFPAGEVVYLPRNHKRNLWSKDYHEGFESIPAGSPAISEEMSLKQQKHSPHIDSHIHGWALEAHCTPQITHFPEQTHLAGCLWLDLAQKVLLVTKLDEKAPEGQNALSQITGRPSGPTKVQWVLAAAKRALKLLKSGSPETREAALILSDTAGSKARAQARQRATMQDRYSGSYEGEYTLDVTTIPTRDTLKIEAIKKRNAHGLYGIELGKFQNDGTLVLYLFDPERPKTREIYFAKVSYPAEGGLKLECKPMVDKSGEIMPDALHLLHCTTSLTLMVGPGGIEGTGLNRLIRYQVKLTACKAAAR